MAPEALDVGKREKIAIESFKRGLGAPAAALPAVVLVVQRPGPREAQPEKHMLVERKYIHLTTTWFIHLMRSFEDLLSDFTAAAYGTKEIEATVTSSGTDGALNIRTINAKGGLTIAQDLETAPLAAFGCHHKKRNGPGPTFG